MSVQRGVRPNQAAELSRSHCQDLATSERTSIATARDPQPLMSPSEVRGLKGLSSHMSVGERLLTNCDQLTIPTDYPTSRAWYSRGVRGESTTDPSPVGTATSAPSMANMTPSTCGKVVNVTTIWATAKISS